MGIETEYGISVPGHPHINSMLTSSQVVNAYAGLTGLDRAGKARWVYADESPLRDARGFDLSRSDADPSQLTDDDHGLANLILTNGARFYVDHAHPEYSTPEVTNPRDAVLWDRAGMVIMQRAAVAASAQPGALPIQLYKNNTDNKGSSYGCHENYLMHRRTPFAEIVRTLTPFFITRQIMSGSGRVGLGQEGRKHGYQLSQRADFFEVEVGLETTLKRPIINTRDEPHADPELHRRLHVIVGDANLSEFATFLKMGATALVLTLIEDGIVLPDITPEKPVAAMHAVSHDISLSKPFTLQSGRRVTALQLQWEFFEAAAKHCQDKYGSAMDEQTREVLDSWETLLTDLERDPYSAADRVDWVAKLSLMEGYQRRDKLGWESPRLQLVDLQYSDIRPERGLAHLLEARGSLRRLTTDEAVERAVSLPPEDTRAYFRGECMRRFTDSIAAASWDSVIFDIEGHDSLQRVPTLEPLKGTRAHVGHLLDEAQSAEDLIRLLRD
jgi:proteasome accessory factor PafA2